MNACMTSCNIFGLVKSNQDIIPFLPDLVPQVMPYSCNPCRESPLQL